MEVNQNIKIEQAIKNLSFPCDYMKNTDQNKPDLYAVYFNLPCNPAAFAYDEVKAVQYQVQFNIFCNPSKSYTLAANDLIDTMKKAGFEVKDGPELYDDQADLIQKSLTFILYEEE